MSAAALSWTRIRRTARGPAAILAGRCAYAAAQFGALAAVGRCCGAETVGDVVLGLAIAVPLFALFGGQLRLVQATDGEGRFAFGTIERSGLVGHAVGFSLFIAIALVFRVEPDSAATLLGVGLARAAESWAEIAYGRLQRRRALTTIGLTTACKSLAGLAVMIGVVSTTRSAGLAYAACAATSLLISIGFDRRLALRGPSENARSDASFAQLFAVGLPLAAGAALATFDTQIPRYFVEGALGSRALATFGVAHYSALALLTLIVPLTYAWTPALSDDVAGGDRVAFERRTRKAVLLATALGLAAVAAAIPAAPIVAFAFADPRLAEGWSFTLIVLAAGALAPAAALEAALRATHGFRLLFLLQAASLAVHFAFCLEGVRLFGLEGAAAATLARSFVYLWLLAFGLRLAKRGAFVGVEAARSAERTDSATEIAGRRAAA